MTVSSRVALGMRFRTMTQYPVGKFAFQSNRNNALDLLLQGRIAANTGTSSIFDAHHV